MLLKKGERPIDRWKYLERNLTRGTRYEFFFYDGDRFEADYSYITNGEDDVEMYIKNIKDKSPNPQYDGYKSLFIGISDLAEIRPA